MTDPRTTTARAILEGCDRGAVAVSKPVRAGFTTSSIYAAEEMGKRLLLISPTNKILKETMAKATGGMGVRVAGNTACPILKEEIEKYPILGELPLALPGECEKCPEFGLCEVTAILTHPDFVTAGLTYGKLRALMASTPTKDDGSQTMAGRIQEVISGAEIVILDEAHILGFGAAPSVAAAHLPGLIPAEFVALERVRSLWRELLVRHGATVCEIEEKAANGATWQHLSRHIDIPNPLEWDDLRSAWGELRALAKSGQVEDAHLLALRDAIEILSYPWAVVHWASDDEGRGGHVQISGSRAKGDLAVARFLQEVAGSAGHVFISGTLIEPHSGYFEELSGKPVKPAIFPDVMRAAEKLTLVPDSWSLNAGGFKRKLPSIIDQIRQIAEREREPIYCLCPNVAKAIVVSKMLKEAGVKRVTVDYYRSDLSIGVARGERISICVGMAEIPAGACDPLARGKDEEKRLIDSRRLRELAVHAATWQALNRVRDPEGVMPSRVYMIGVRLDAVRELARWGPNRQAVLKHIRNGTMPDGKAWLHVDFTIKVDEDIEHCNILGEDMKRTRSDQRSITHMVEKIELYDEDSIKRENHYILPIIIYREKVAKITFYNFPSNESEFDSNATSLYKAFVLRDDTYAEQLKKGGYARVCDYLRYDVLMDHVNRRKTAGVYEISVDDEVIWGCFDVDSHDADDDGTESRAKVRSICDVLEVYDVPYMLEASGSPNSYHIWIFFKITRTYNAYRFMRQVRSEAKIKAGDVEIFPKQKKVDLKRYGNLVKLPLGINQKHGARSAFLDAGTFELLEGEIRFPGRVVLLEIPDFSGDGLAMPKARKVKRAEDAGATCGSGSLDYCMVKAIVEGEPLKGGPGHLLRVAIATKAAFIGMSPAEAGALFSGQPDYDADFSRAKAEEIGARNYSPWSCEKLRDSCGELVTRWCPTCPFGGGLRLEVAV